MRKRQENNVMTRTTRAGQKKIEEEEDPTEVAAKLEAWKKKKFEAAQREAAKRETAQRLYMQRTAFCDAKLKPILEKMVLDVSSAKAPGRPENPVPMMIEFLAEYAGRPIRSFKNNTPENRLKREIAELEREVAKLEDLVQQPYEEEWTDGSTDEDEDEDDEEPEVECITKGAVYSNALKEAGPGMKSAQTIQSGGL